MMYRWLVLIALMMALSACRSDSAERENVSSQAVSLQQGAGGKPAQPPGLKVKKYVLIV